MYKYYWVQINPESQLSLRVCAVGLADLPAVIDRKVEKLYSFVWGFSSHSRIFHSYGDVTINGEGLQIFTLYSAFVTIVYRATHVLRSAQRVTAIACIHGPGFRKVVKYYTMLKLRTCFKNFNDVFSKLAIVSSLCILQS